MLLPIQSLGLIPEVSPDSLEVKTQQITELLRETPPQELLKMFTDQAIQFGIKVVLALVIYFVGGWIIRLVTKAVKKAHKKHNTEPTLATFVESLISLGLWVILIMVTISTLGVSSTSMAALLASGGVAIGMAMSGTVQNFAGGIMLLVFKPFKVDDFIEVLGYSGTVTEVTIVSTKLRTPDNRQIILPNGALSNGNMINVNRLPVRRIDIPVSVAYGSNAEDVKNALLEIAASHELVLNADTPGAAAPVALLTELADSSVNFALRVWVKSPDYWTVRFWLNENIYTLLPEKYGIQFPFPQMDVHIKS